MDWPPALELYISWVGLINLVANIYSVPYTVEERKDTSENETCRNTYIEKEMCIQVFNSLAHPRGGKGQKKTHQI